MKVCLSTFLCALSLVGTLAPGMSWASAAPVKRLALVVGNNSGGDIVDPAALEKGEPLSLGGSLTGDQPGEVIDQVDGPTRSGTSRVPISSVAGEYTNRATRAAERSQLPPSQQQLVGSYFDLISQL